jgi:hypothetical protein
VSRDITAGFTRIDLEGSRHRDVALVFCAVVLAAVMAVQPVAAILVTGGMALLLTAGALIRGRWPHALHCADDDGTLCWTLANGRQVAGKVVAARMGRRWLSVTVRPDRGRAVSVMLLGDQFVRADDFRRFRLWLRKALRDDGSVEDAGWSAWLRRWYPGSRD